jgi:hypothetical protein
VVDTFKSPVGGFERDSARGVFIQRDRHIYDAGVVDKHIAVAASEYDNRCQAEKKIK